MGTVLVFLGFFILTITIGFAFCIGFCITYNMYKRGYYGFAFLQGIFLLLLLSAILILVGSLI